MLSLLFFIAYLVTFTYGNQQVAHAQLSDQELAALPSYSSCVEGQLGLLLQADPHLDLTHQHIDYAHTQCAYADSLIAQLRY